VEPVTVMPVLGTVREAEAEMVARPAAQKAKVRMVGGSADEAVATEARAAGVLMAGRTAA